MCLMSCQPDSVSAFVLTYYYLTILRSEHIAMHMLEIHQFDLSTFKWHQYVLVAGVTAFQQCDIETITLPYITASV